MTKPGHNSRAKAGPIQADRLKSFVERIEKLEEERKAIGGDIKDVYAEAKGVGYDVKTMRKIVALRSMDAADRAEAETLLDVYCHALGMDAVGYGGAPREPSEEELEALAGRIVAEVDRCMDLVGDGNQLPTIRAIQDAIGCSAGKASKLRGMVQERISRSGAVQREMKSPHDADGVVTEPQEKADDEERPATSCISGPVLRTAAREGDAVRDGVSRGDANTAESGAGCSENGSHKDEASAPRSVGAVAAEPRVAPTEEITSKCKQASDLRTSDGSERITPFMGDDPGAPPPFLLRAQAGRGAA